MANFSIYSSLLPAILLSFALYSCSARIVTVKKFCSKHPNPSFCASVLNGKAGSAAGADLASLGQYVIVVAHEDAFNALTLIHALIGNTSEAQLKQHYISCSGHYNDALLSLNDAKQAWSSSEYSGLYYAAADVQKVVQDCDSEPVADPSSLPRDNKQVEDVVSIVTII